VKASASTSARFALLALACLTGAPAHAASGAFADSVAHVLAVFIIFALPIGGVVLFWLVHILPEKAAEKRHHPQKDAIQVLCLLSLVFGGLLWPLAWLWAYTKPVLHKAAYGRDKHDDYYAELKGKEEPTEAEALELHEELARLRHELEDFEKRSDMPDALQGIRARLARLEHRAGPGSTSGEGSG
jgi:Protein of unknown function (DUF3302)